MAKKKNKKNAPETGVETADSGAVPQVQEILAASEFEIRERTGSGAAFSEFAEEAAVAVEPEAPAAESAPAEGAAEESAPFEEEPRPAEAALPAKELREEDIGRAIEALLFITDQPIALARVAGILGIKDVDAVSRSIEELRAHYEAGGRGIQLLEIAEGYQLSTKPHFAPYVRKLYSERMTMRLSTAALETLAIVAYKQPLTRAEIEEIRGVEVIAALETLLEKRLLRVVGRKESVGRPLLYGTTSEFLRQFGLRGLTDLPPIESFTPAELAKPEGPRGPFAQEEAPAAEASDFQPAGEPDKPEVHSAEDFVGAEESSNEDNKAR